MHAISIDGIELLLLAKRGLFWPEQKTLFIADTHFGKEATFRSHGVAVPRGSTSGTLLTIAEMIADSNATRLILLGDMFHARSSISDDIQRSLDRFFADHSQLTFSLVLGNHDRGIPRRLGSWPIDILDSGSKLGRISVSHIPQEPSEGSDLLLCGHLHPAYRFQTKTDSLGKLSCFWLSNKQLVLPAIGQFTGTYVVKPIKTDRTWVIAGDQVVEVAS
jgi:uncharacterized protein